MIVTYRADSGGLCQLSIDAMSFDEATLKTAHGVYAVFRTYPDFRVFRLEEHLERMRRSAHLLDQSYPLSNSWIRKTIREVLIREHCDPAQVRVTVPYNQPDSLLIYVKAFEDYHPNLFEVGVNAALAQHKRQKARAKDSRFILERNDIIARNPSAYEVILYDDDRTILEGVTSNLFFVLDGQLRTAEDGVLAGIARSLLLDVAPVILPVVCIPISLDDLPDVSEAILTSSSRGPVPVVEIAGKTVGEGKLGPVFRSLQVAYLRRVEHELENL
jgi:branched-chain amino acid aminotransferase